MASEDDVLRQLQQQISALQASREQQLERDTARAQAEVSLRRRAAETTQGLIKLNVGGTRYTTSLATLTAIPEAYFSSLFSGDWQQVLTAEGEVFLDRDGERFKIILEYLRAARDQQAFLVPRNLERRELASLAAEAQYFGLVALQESLQAAADVTKPAATYDYKHGVFYHINMWNDDPPEGSEDRKLHKLYDEGWEQMESNAFYAGNCCATYIALRRLKG